MGSNEKRFVLLHNVRSVHNVGSIFRTAEGAGVAKIFLTGYTPAPTDRFGRIRSDVAKVALGAEKIVPWEYEPEVNRVLARLKKDGIQVVAVEQDARSVVYTDFHPERQAAFVFGNEPDGLPEEVRAQADVIIEIPMHGKKESLNVSVAAGIILFHGLYL